MYRIIESNGAINRNSTANKLYKFIIEDGTAIGGYNTAAVPYRSNQRLLVNTQASAYCKVVTNLLLFRSLADETTYMI